MKKNALLLLAFVGAMGALAYRGGWFDRSTPQSLQPGNPSSAGAGGGPGLRPAPLTSVSLPVPRTLDMTHVAPAHFAVALGKDPGRIFAFVRDQIAFEAYSGGLRGPRGTLLAMAGNSVDRAALLGSLLVQSGQRVRYVHGTLPKELARSLVTSMWGERRLPPPSSADEERSPSLAAAMETFGNGVRRDYTLIRDRLKRARLAGASGIAPDLDSLVREAEAHYWVQWWKNGSWFDLDPSFAEAVPGQTFAPPGQASDTLPETLFHQVTLRLRLEESGILVEGDGDVKPVIRDILTYKARAADLSGLDMVLSHQPENWKGPAKTIQAALGFALANTGGVQPVLQVGQSLVMGEAFRQKLPAAGGMTGVFGRLSGEGTRTAVPIATGQWLELEFVGPGGQKETVVREIFDLRGKAQRAAGQTPSAAEIRARSAAADAFDVTHAFYSLFFTTGAIDTRHAAHLAKGPPASSGDPDGSDAFLRRISITFVLAADTVLSRLTRPGQAPVVSYPTTPRLQITELSTIKGRDRIALDLRRTGRRVVAADFQPDAAFFGQVFCGVVEGTIERMLMEYVTARAPDASWKQVMSTSSLFERARAETVDTLLLPHDGAFAGEIPADVRARMNDAVAGGDLVLAPQRTITVGEERRMAWWQIDPTTGETIAVTDEGLHQTAVCYTERTNQETGETEVVVRWVRGGREFNAYQTFGITETTQYESLITSIERSAVRLPWHEFPF